MMSALIRRTRFLVATLTLLSPLPAVAADDLKPYALDLHFGTLDYSGCGLVESDFACDMIQPNNPTPSGGATYVAVFLSGIEPGTEFGAPGGVSGLRFGIDYDATVNVEGWTLCTGGAEVPEAAWPTSTTGNVVSWPGSCRPSFTNADRIVPVGYFVLGEGSDGHIRALEDPRVGLALVLDCEQISHPMCPELFGVGNASTGTTGGYATCGESCAIIDVPPGGGVLKISSWGQVKGLYR